MLSYHLEHQLGRKLQATRLVPVLSSALGTGCLHQHMLAGPVLLQPQLLLVMVLSSSPSVRADTSQQEPFQQQCIFWINRLRSELQH